MNITHKTLQICTLLIKDEKKSELLLDIFNLKTRMANEDGTLGKNAKTFEIVLNFKVTSLFQANGSPAK